MQVAIGLAMLDPDEAFIQKMYIVRLTEEESDIRDEAIAKLADGSQMLLAKTSSLFTVVLGPSRMCSGAAWWRALHRR